MRMPSLVIPIFALIATACQIGVPVDIEVKSSTSVQFTIPQDHREHFCLNSATIFEVTPAGERPVWRIRLRPQSSGLCDTSFNFPHPPPQFITEIDSTQLAPGSYRVAIDGGLPQASGEFSIPRGAP